MKIMCFTHIQYENIGASYITTESIFFLHNMVVLMTASCFDKNLRANKHSS